MKIVHSHVDLSVNFRIVGMSRGMIFSSLFILDIKFADTLCFGLEIVQFDYCKYLVGVKRNKCVQISPKS